MNKRLKPFLFFLGGVVTVCLLAAGIFGLNYALNFSPKSTGEHKIANKIADNISFVPYLKDGNLYFYEAGQNKLVAENVYSKDSEDPIYTADYAIDASSGKVLYTSNRALYLFDGSKTQLIAQNVIAWRTAEGLNNVAFVTSTDKEATKGLLFLWNGGEIISLDNDVVASTLRFSQDGTFVLAQKENVYPKTNYILLKYDLLGAKTLLNQSTYPIMWVNDDASTIITGSSEDDEYYYYRIFAQNMKREKKYARVYFSAVTPDKSIVYLLHDYDTELKQGVLTAVDLETLKTKEIARGVSFFNIDGVTDSSKGLLYSVLTDSENGYSSIYYGEISGKATRLIKNTTEDALYNIAINSQKKSGYLLTYGATARDGGVYYVSWNKKDLEVERIASGNVDSLTYYELNHAITFVKNAQSGIAELFVADSTLNATKLTDDCGVEYSPSSQTYSSMSVLSNSAKECLYFTSVKTGDTTVDQTGTLKLVKDGQIITIDENVSARYMESPITAGNMDVIFYLKENKDGTLDAYKFEKGEKTLIATNVHGLIEVE